MPDEDQVEQRTQSQVCRRGLRGASGTIDDGAGRLPREGSEELIIQAEKKGWAAAAEGAKHSARGGVQTEAQTRTDTGVRVVQRMSWEAKGGPIQPRLRAELLSPWTAGP